jgi:hypothetical protein
MDMPEEIEVETKELQETIDEMREERDERAKEAKETAWTRWISLSTALLAVFAAIAALQAGSLVNEALIAKNNSVLNQAKASDQWAYYQAKGIKGNGARQTADLLAATPSLTKQADKWREEAKRYKEEQKEAEAEARKLEAERDEKNKESAELMEHHEVFAFCVTFLQVAIALSAVAALTKQKLVWYLSLLVGIAGLIYFGNGFARSAQPRKPAAETPVERSAPAPKAENGKKKPE